MDCSIFDEDMVCDELETILEEGGSVVDFHSAGFLQDDWFDLVVVLRAETNILYSRLEKRHYPEPKIRENVEAEIFQTCLEEAHEAFEEAGTTIWELPHNTQEEMEAAVERVRQFAETFGSRG